MIDRQKMPPIVDAVDYQLELKPYAHHQLANGVDVYMIDAGAEEVLQMEWLYKAGNCYESQNLIAATTNYLLRAGTTQHTAYDLDEQIDYVGAYVNRGCYNQQAGLTLHCLNKHIDVLLPLIREVLTDSIFPAHELLLYQQNMKQRLSVNLRKSDYVAGRLIDAYLFGEDHPYGRYSSPASFDLLTREAILAFYDRYYLHGHFQLFVAGKIPADLLKKLNRYFGDLPIHKTDLPIHTICPSVQKKFNIQNDPAGVQGAIRIARPFPGRHHPDFLPALVLNTVFGGFFGSRLMNNIREEKGYTYGIHSHLLNLQQTSAWMISTEAGKEVCEATIKEVYAEMNRICNEPISEEELNLVRNYMMGGLLGDLDGPFQLIARWKNLILNDLPPAHFYRTIDTIRTVKARQLQELAQRYLNPSDFYELVVV
ncbi:MAG: insulinase family protein [Bacteroidetes bacterium]|nr:insulinase family protein [Bacteroidota bacterium]